MTPTPPVPVLRVARPSTDLQRTTKQWTQAWSLSVLTSFADHATFDGVILGHPHAPYHFEFTRCSSHPITPSVSDEDMTVFYYPERDEWEAACKRAEEAGWKRVVSSNVYWEEWGASWADADGYVVVAARRGWTL